MIGEFKFARNIQKILVRLLNLHLRLILYPHAGASENAVTAGRETPASLLRYTIAEANLPATPSDPDYRPDFPPYVFAFWHRCIFAGTWYFRNRNAVLMNTTNFDGQWTRRVIERLGYQRAQGSPTRGGLRGLFVLA